MHLLPPNFILLLTTGGWGVPPASEILVLQPRMEAAPSPVEAWSLNHWTSRQVLLNFKR